MHESVFNPCEVISHNGNYIISDSLFLRYMILIHIKQSHLADLTLLHTTYRFLRKPLPRISPVLHFKENKRTAFIANQIDLPLSDTIVLRLNSYASFF